MSNAGDDTDIPFDLNEGEIWWRDHYDLLKKHGYDMRPRYRPGWKPSWPAHPKHAIDCEDSFVTYNPKVIDAIRVSDKARVAIKKLRMGSKELKIVRYLNSEELRKDPRNNCVPLLHVFSEPYDPLLFVEFMVMPLLKKFNDPPFSSVDEVLDFIRQTLEGLSFMHSKRIAHRDCSILNIMLDASPMFPKGFHPTDRQLDASGKNLARPRRRRDIKGIKYYFTDFGISSWFDGTSENHLVTGKDCQDRELPELHQDDPYDPFLADVFILGNLYRRCLIGFYENLAFLTPLTDAMTQKTPSDRPTIDESLGLLNELVEQQSPRLLRRLLVFRDANRVDRILCDIGSTKREVILTIKSCLLFLTKNQ